MRPLFNSKTTHLAEIIAKSQYLERLGKQLLKHLEPELAKHCMIANFEKGILNIEVDNAAWATRLRYSSPELLKKFRAEEKLYNLRSIKCYIRPKSQPLMVDKKVYLSPGAAQSIGDFVPNVIDPELKAALTRLLKNTES